MSRYVTPLGYEHNSTYLFEDEEKSSYLLLYGYGQSVYGQKVVVSLEENTLYTRLKSLYYSTIYRQN